MTPAKNPALEVGNKLVDLCRHGKNLEAIDTLYADDIESIEAFAMEGHPKRIQGKQVVLGKSKWWMENHEIHGGDIKGPFPADDGRFAAYMRFDVTPRVGPMKDRRFTMEEVCLYTVKDGKIVKEEFFYDMGG